MEKDMVMDLKKRVPLYLRVAFLVAILFFIVAFLLVPHYTLHPYVPRVEKATKVEVEPEEIKQVEELPPPAKPQMPVEAESEEEIEAATIEKTADFETFEKLPVEPEAETPKFVAYDTPPRPKKQIIPVYPEIAKQAGIEGTVILHLLIDTNGKVLRAKVLKGLTEDTNKAAIDAALKSTFYPAKQRDKPVKVWVSFPIKFVLKE
jgi:protein TonB